MNTFLAIILALTVKTDLLEPKVLYQNDRELQPNAQVVSSFYAGKNRPVKVDAKGDGHGDLNCYLLKGNDSGEGWVIAASDESNLDQCSITYTPSVAQPLRLWVKNDGVHPTKYSVVVKQ